MSPATPDNQSLSDNQLPSKRKLDDFDLHSSPGDDLSPFYPRHSKNNGPSNSKGKSVIQHALAETSNRRAEVAHFLPRLQLQFFVKMISGGQTLVFQADFADTVVTIHKRIELITRIPLMEQRLIYRGRQLQWEHTLAECGVENDASLQLVGRMRSTHHPRAWRVISDLVTLVCNLLREDTPTFECRNVKFKLEQFMALQLDKHSEFSPGVVATKFLCGRNRIDDDDDDGDEEEEEENRVEGGRGCENKNDYYRIFMDAFAPQALVIMYLSSDKRNQECADECIRCFVSFVKDMSVRRDESVYCALTVLAFCGLLRGSVPEDNLLYLHCRSSLGSILDKVYVARSDEKDSPVRKTITFVAIQDIFPFLKEVGERLVKDMMLTVESNTSFGPLLRDVCDFSAFLKSVIGFLGEEFNAAAAARKGKGKGKAKICPLGEEFKSLFCLYSEMLTWMDKCLGKLELGLAFKRKKDVEIYQSGWSQYLTILKELSSIAALYPGAVDRFWAVMSQNKVAIRALVVQYTTRAEDHCWLLRHKDLLDFESRRHLAMLMFPEVKEDYEELHEMLIDRSQLLAESFEYISSAQPASLHAGLFMEFKNEEATGPGVLREWFCLVCQAIFDPQNALFVACPLDRRRFYPCPASKVDPLHLRYFRFAGRVIALALMHKVQVGIVIDRVLFSQLAGKSVSLEDIRDADPCIYNSCRQILDMDPEFVDADGLGLTFVTEVEELGSRKVVELCSSGKGIIVTSKNRKDYVNLLIQNRFVTSISEQVSSFAQGFADILRDGKQRATFFESLEPEDLDWMLRGSGNEISVDDWEAHTDYNGFKKSDPQIIWFWEVVGQLNAEQKKALLFFWTSVKYLPIEGFRGLASRVYIYKSLEPQDRLPSSHTCFYRLCIPPYSSKAIMQDRLRVITQEHVGCSFGIW